MELAVLVLVGIALALLALLALAVVLLRRSQDVHAPSLSLMQQQVAELRQEMGRLIAEGQRIQEVGRAVGELQDLFRAPKLRGELGEHLLTDLVSQVVPRQHWETQHRFSDGKQVDMVIALKEGTLPVDAKFPLENFRHMLQASEESEQQRYRRAFIGDVKGHIDAIASGYIKPQEGTLPVAFMYIPAENIYYETIIKEEGQKGQGLLEYALSRQVIPVSPSSFYAYLQVIALGLRGMQIEGHAQEVMARLVQLRRDLGQFQEEFATLGRHLQHASSKYTDAAQKLGRLDQRLESAEESHPPASLPSRGPDDTE